MTDEVEHVLMRQVKSGLSRQSTREIDYNVSLEAIDWTAKIEEQKQRKLHRMKETEWSTNWQVGGSIDGLLIWTDRSLKGIGGLAKYDIRTGRCGSNIQILVNPCYPIRMYTFTRGHQLKITRSDPVRKAMLHFFLRACGK